MNIARTRWVRLAVAAASMTGCAFGEADQEQSSAAHKKGGAVQVADRDNLPSDDYGVAPTTAAMLVELPPVREVAEDVSIADPSVFRQIEELSPEELERTLREETTIEPATGRIEALPRLIQESK
jgi:hypothetical protein